MAKISKKALVSPELARLREGRYRFVQTALQRRFNPVNDGRHLLHINGRVPFGEPIRGNRKACRSSAMRIVGHGIDLDQIINLNGMSWDQRRAYKRLVPQIVEDLEQEGIIEYRPVNPPEANARIGQQGIAA